MRRSRCKAADVVLGAFTSLPVLAVVFGVLALEAWMHLCIYAFDYERVRLSTEISAVTSHMEELRAREAELGSMIRFDEKAPMLGLVMPEPNQVRIVKASPVETDLSGRPYDVAQRPASERQRSGTEQSIP